MRVRVLLFLFLFIPSAHAQPIYGGSGPIIPGFVEITEEDNSPTCDGSTIKVTNSTLTNNNDGTCSIDISGSGAPDTVDYLVGTADAGLSNEIVVGTTPGGELGNTWPSPTIDDGVTVTSWAMGASTADTPSANDDDTSLATTAYVQTEINALGGTDLTCASGTCNVDNPVTAATLATNITVGDTTDTTSFVALFESATGDLPPKSDLGILYNAGTGDLVPTLFAGVANANIVDKTAVETITRGWVIDGTADENQLRLQGHSTQGNIFVVEKSDGDDVMTVNTLGVRVAKNFDAASQVQLSNTPSCKGLKTDGSGIVDCNVNRRNFRYLALKTIAPATDVTAATDQFGDYVSPFAGTIQQSDSIEELLSAACETAGTTGTMIVDVHLNGTTIMTTNKLDIETTEKSTTTATTQPDLTTTALAIGDIITVDIDTIHTTACKGLTVYMTILED